MTLLALLLLACTPTAPAPEVHTPTAPEAPVSEAPQLTERVRVSLPFDRAMPVPGLGGTARLVSSETDHAGDDLVPSSSGVLELARGGEVEQVAFIANRQFMAWDHRMAVFGASGSLELSVFPEGAPFEP